MKNLLKRVANKFYRAIYFPLRLKITKFFGGEVYILKDGRKMYYEFNSDIGHKLFHLGRFEENELKIIEKFLKEDSVVLDIGANLGIHSIRYALKHPGRTVFSFEPAHKTYQFLLKNIEGIRNIIPINIGLSNENGIQEFFTASDNAYSSLKDTKIKNIVGKEKVLIDKLDDIIPLLDIKKLDLIKIDVEGNDQKTLEGMASTIKKFEPIIFCEIVKSDHLNPNPDKTISFIQNLGYNIYVVKENKIIPYSGHDNQYYQHLFIPKKLNIIPPELLK